MITSAQESAEKVLHNTGWVLRGFQNIDKVLFAMQMQYYNVYCT